MLIVGPFLNVAPEKAIARFSYHAENEDELSLKEGDIITVIEKELEDVGWWKGEINGRIGVFPDNFVELIPSQEEVSKKLSLSLSRHLVSLCLHDMSHPNASAFLQDILPFL